MKNFKVGDKVVVVQSGNTYTTYDRMFVKMQFKDQKCNPGFENGMTATVFAVDFHDDTNKPLVGLQAQDGKQALMGFDGIELLSTQPTSIDKFDIIRQFCDEVLGSQDIADRTIFKYLLERCCE